MLYLLFIVTIISTVGADGKETTETEQLVNSFPCSSLSRTNYSCSACIQFHPSCAWCGAPLFDDAKQYSRCDTRQKLLSNGCRANDITDPKTKKIVRKDKRLSNHGTADNEAEAVQLKPQNIYVEIRPKSPIRFNITYRQAKDYPVDLYYLMDLSFSMKDDKQKLSELGDLLAKRMRIITKNFRLGFGSFIDKKMMPFVDFRPEKLRSPCQYGQCVPTYGFIHRMNLTSDTSRFKSEVNRAQISGNLDAPEGGFDAIVQVLACEKQIGWRERARRMIVFSTDAEYHLAGDGRLAGIIEPNDGKCHLDNRGVYTESTTQDYPSIALLHQMIKDHKANIIFAVTEKHQSLYADLSNALPDVSTAVGVLANDSNNIVELIEKEYKKISEQIIMGDNASTVDGLRITYRSACSAGITLQDTNFCEGVRIGGEVMFEVTLEAIHCVKKKDFVLRIGPSGIDEAVRVDVKVLCDCDCADPKNIIKNVKKCNGGDVVCGVCHCKGGRAGKLCECDKPGMSTSEMDAKCKRTNESAICEGRGVCNCGRCECNPRQNPDEQISGDFCECDNFNCPRHDRKVCAEHGQCNCGQCNCDYGWTGRACECPIRKDSCISPNGKICNGKGSCICGRCKCLDGADGSKYSGAKCDVCPTCPTKCIEYKPCVMCQQWQTGPYNESSCSECPFSVTAVNDLPGLDRLATCQFVDPSDQCTFYYEYQIDEITEQITVWVRKQKDCSNPVPVLSIIIGVVAGIVVLGIILLLLWKLLTVLHDRAEFARFEEERRLAIWATNENPLYKQATSTFQNPVFVARKRKGT